MCIAIVKPKGKTISDEALKNCYDRNPDGAGIAFAKGGKIYILKGIFNKNEFVDAIRKYEKVQEGSMLIHCRIGTSGLKDKENCHPHVINSKLVMIHNGIIRIDVPNDSKISDTVIFAQQYLRQLPSDFVKNEKLMELIKMAIGSNNKLCFLNEKGEYAIVNEEAGVWDDGVWYSNHTYETPKVTYQPYLFNYYDYTDCDGNRYYKWNDKAKNYNNKLINNLSKKEEETGLPSKSKVKKLKKMIRNMSDKKMLEIGEFPLYDRINNTFAEYKESFNANQYICLDEYSTDVFEEWMYEYDERFGYMKNNTKIGA